MRKKLAYITRPVLILSLVSCFADIASEMLYPVMPVYLSSIGFSVFLIGLLEGLAETTAGIGKGYFGQLSDIRGNRLPFVRWGYFLSAVSKPLLAVSALPLWILGARFIDRLGKGTRTGARDALLSDLSAPETKARVFGFHRALDTLGAVMGPLLALLYLQWRPEDYKGLFLLAFGPGLISVSLLLLLKEKKSAPKKEEKIALFSYFKYYKKGNTSYRYLLKFLLLFALFNSSDVLLLLKMKESGADETLVLTVYIFYNIVFALFSFPLGMLADRWGLRRTFLAGIGIYILVYLGFDINTQPGIYWLLFFGYGLYAAATDGIAKAWIALQAKKSDTGNAMGLYSSVTGMAAFFASSMAGLIWWQAGAVWAFGITALAAAVVFIGIAIQPADLLSDKKAAL